jgi:peptidoglycan hydrolase FlgJ
MTSSAAAGLSQSIAALGAANSAQAQAALKLKGKAKAAAQQFEAMFLNTMFQQMFAGVNGEGPFGGSGALNFAQNGGIGIASHVYDALLKQQGVSKQ